MKDIVIKGKLVRVFVLRETDERIVHIPLKSLHRVDYDRLVKIEKASGSDDMLTTMSSYSLDNGKNALVQYDDHIQVYIKERSGNLSDPTSVEENTLKGSSTKQEDKQEEPTTTQPKRRGRPPKSESKS